MIDPVTIAAAFAAFDGIAKVIASFKDGDLTTEQLVKKKAIEDASRKNFDEYVASVAKGG